MDKYRAQARLRNREIVNGIKADTNCADCGEWWPGCAMDFDHVAGVKRDNISKMVNLGVSEARLLAELDKCDLVCACCHRLRSQSRR